MIRFAIVGYGNLGKSCEKIAYSSHDFEMVGIFTRRDPSSIVSPFGTKVYKQNDIKSFKGKIDVVALCTGSANDLCDLAKSVAKDFNTIDGFDTHAVIPQYVDELNSINIDSKTLSFVCIGWDPGLFSLIRTLFEGVLPNGYTQTFWGKGVSQGHSEAIRRIDGVLDAKQYTIPKDEAIEKTKNGQGASLTTREKHLRECFVVLKDGANAEYVKQQIVNMPNYFADYDTIVHFISKEEFDLKHQGIPHGGFVLRNGKVGDFSNNLDLSIKLDSNPDFTASVMMAYAKANYKMFKKGVVGTKTIIDIPVSELIDGDWKDIIHRFV